MKIARLEGKLAVELPADIVDALGLREGDEVDVVVERKLSDEAVKERRREALDKMHGALGNGLPPGYKFDREEANAR